MMHAGILKYINSIPFPFTLKHYYDIGKEQKSLIGLDLTSEKAWDEVRLKHPHFVIPETREEWLKGLVLKKDGQDGLLEQRAIDIAALLREKKITYVHSVGVGGGAFEYYIKKHMPEVYLVASDYNPLGVERLKKVFTECDEVKVFDIFKDNWDVPENGLVLMFRVDPHFTDKEWRDVILKMKQEKVPYILYIPANYLTVKYVVKERYNAFRGLFSGRATSFAGYVRTRKMFETYWRPYKIQTHYTLGAKSSFFLS